MNANAMLSSIQQYWNRRAPSYTEVILKNLAGQWESVWADELIRNFPEGEGLRVLDIGTGPGFYAIILAKRGYQVTAVDYSEGMLEEAKHNAGALAEKITFRQMDAHHLDFPDNSFDVIVTRNLTWNLADPVLAYSDWQRVLVPGGVMLNFDANWYSYLFDEEKKEEYDHDRENAHLAGVEDHESYEDADRMEQISRELPLGRLARPEWDIRVLKKLGFASVTADADAGSRVWNEEEKINYASTPGFMIRAVKG